nr:11407_t:CDS:2 [Entrophospora candida]
MVTDDDDHKNHMTTDNKNHPVNNNISSSNSSPTVTTITPSTPTTSSSSSSKSTSASTSPSTLHLLGIDNPIINMYYLDVNANSTNTASTTTSSIYNQATPPSNIIFNDFNNGDFYNQNLTFQCNSVLVNNNFPSASNNNTASVVATVASATTSSNNNSPTLLLTSPTSFSSSSTINANLTNNNSNQQYSSLFSYVDTSSNALQNFDFCNNNNNNIIIAGSTCHTSPTSSRSTNFINNSSPSQSSPLSTTINLASISSKNNINNNSANISSILHPPSTSIITFNGNNIYTKWTEEEDELLKAAINIYGPHKWSLIAAHVPNRTPMQCSTRWLGALNPTIHKGRWTPEEDSLLKEAVGEYLNLLDSDGHPQPIPWNKIAQRIPHRTGIQCQARWSEALDPSVRKGKWSPDEDEILKDGVRRYGRCWIRIAELIDGRTQRQCRTRWVQIRNKQAKTPSTPRSSKTSTAAATAIILQHASPFITPAVTTTSPIINNTSPDNFYQYFNQNGNYISQQPSNIRPDFFLQPSPNTINNNSLMFIKSSSNPLLSPAETLLATTPESTVTTPEHFSTTTTSSPATSSPIFENFNLMVRSANTTAISNNTSGDSGSGINNSSNNIHSTPTKNIDGGNVDGGNLIVFNQNMTDSPFLYD